jgi:hypothetical protein
VINSAGGWDPGVNVSKKTASLNPTQSHYDSFEYFLDNLTIFLDKAKWCRDLRVKMRTRA